jgi:hypothetical protein
VKRLAGQASRPSARARARARRGPRGARQDRDRSVGLGERCPQLRRPARAPTGQWTRPLPGARLAASSSCSAPRRRRQRRAAAALELVQLAVPRASAAARRSRARPGSAAGLRPREVEGPPSAGSLTASSSGAVACRRRSRAGCGRGRRTR